MPTFIRIYPNFFDQFPEDQKFSIFSRDYDTGIFERTAAYLSKHEVERRIANSTSVLNLANCRNKENYGYYFTRDYIYNKAPKGLPVTAYIVKAQ